VWGGMLRAYTPSSTFLPPSGVPSRRARIPHEAHRKRTVDPFRLLHPDYYAGHPSRHSGGSPSSTASGMSPRCIRVRLCSPAPNTHASVGEEHAHIANLGWSRRVASRTACRPSAGRDRCSPGRRRRPTRAITPTTLAARAHALQRLIRLLRRPHGRPEHIVRLTGHHQPQ